MTLRKTCPYCGRTFTAHQRRQKSCRHPECQRQRIYETRQERAARAAEAARAEEERRQRKLRTRRLYERTRRAERRMAA